MPPDEGNGGLEDTIEGRVLRQLVELTRKMAGATKHARKLSCGVQPSSQAWQVLFLGKVAPR